MESATGRFYLAYLRSRASCTNPRYRGWTPAALHAQQDLLRNYSSYSRSATRKGSREQAQALQLSAVKYNRRASAITKASKEWRSAWSADTVEPKNLKTSETATIITKTRAKRVMSIRVSKAGEGVDSDTNSARTKVPQRKTPDRSGSSMRVQGEAFPPKARRSSADSAAASQPSGSGEAGLRSAISQNQKRETREKEDWRIQKAALGKKFEGQAWNPRKRLSPDALEGIRALNASDPEKYSTPVLAQQFAVSPESIRRILKSKWQPREDEVEDRRRRWDKRGEAIWGQMTELGLRPEYKKWKSMGQKQKKEPETIFYDGTTRDFGRGRYEHLPWETRGSTTSQDDASGERPFGIPGRKIRDLV